MNLTLNFHRFAPNLASSELVVSQITILSTTGALPPLGNLTINADTYVLPVTDNTEVEIEITEAGRYPYKNKFKVYDQDETLEIVLVQEYDNIQSLTYLYPYPQFTFIQNPCNKQVDVYNTSSYPGNMSYYINNKEVYQGENFSYTFCDAGEFQIKARGTSYIPSSCPSELAWDIQYVHNKTALRAYTGSPAYGVVNDIEDYLQDDVSTNISIVEYKPSVNLINTPPFDSNKSSCKYQKDEQITIYPEIEFNNPTSVNYNIQYIVKNYKQVEVLNENFDITTSSDLTTEADISFTFDDLGLYTVEVIVIDKDCNETYNIGTFEYETCNFVEFRYISCNNYELYNNSSATDIKYSVEQVLENGNGDLIVDCKDILAGENDAIVLDTVLLHKVTVQYGETTEEYLINNYCAIEECILKFTKKLFCESCGCTSKCEDELEIIRLTTLLRTYYTKLNSEFGFGNYFTSLEEKELQLPLISKLLQKINSICSNCSTITKSNCNCK
jgi:hypothetical protein